VYNGRAFITSNLKQYTIAVYLPHVTVPFGSAVHHVPVHLSHDKKTLPFLFIIFPYSYHTSCPASLSVNMSNSQNGAEILDARSAWICLLILVCFGGLCAIGSVIKRRHLPPHQDPFHPHLHNVDLEHSWGDGDAVLLQRPQRALVRRGSPSSDISYPAPRYGRHVEDGVVTNPEQVKLEQRGNYVFALEVKGEEPPAYRAHSREELEGKGVWGGVFWSLGNAFRGVTKRTVGK
jgi:hypothetical protein